MAAKFILKENKAGEVYFVLNAANGEPIGTSESYSSDAAAKDGIESVRKTAVEAKIEDQTADKFEELTHPKFEVYKDKAGEFRFRLKAVNGEIILTGESYKAKAGVLGGIESIKKNAPEAIVE